MPGLRAGWRQRVARHLVRGLGHPVGLDHRRIEDRLEFRPAPRTGSAADDERMNRNFGKRGPSVRSTCHVEHRLVDRRDRRVPGRAVLLDPSRHVAAPGIPTCRRRCRRRPATRAALRRARGCGTAASRSDSGRSGRVGAWPRRWRPTQRLRAVSGTSFGCAGRARGEEQQRGAGVNAPHAPGRNVQRVTREREGSRHVVGVELDHRYPERPGGPRAAVSWPRATMTARAPRPVS